MSGKIHVFPAWRQNPYLNMLYLGARSEGWLVEGSTSMNALAEAIPGLTHGDVVHIHWTSPILHESESESEARQSFNRFVILLDDLRAAGVRLIWTVHNTLAHDATFPELEVAVAQLLAARADRIVQINRQTRDAVSEHYDLPIEKLVTLRHASYAGIYAQPPSRLAARARLGVTPTAAAVGFIGQMRGYKGIPTLLRAMGHATRYVDDLTLILAGKTTTTDLAQIQQHLPDGLPAVRHHSFVSDDEIATWYSACDVLVFPYDRVLNSGSVLLAATFARPCILPAEPHLVAEYGSQPWVSFYETGNGQAWSLAKAISAALSTGQGTRQAAQAFADEYTTFHMAWDYLAIIEDMDDASTVRERR